MTPTKTILFLFALPGLVACTSTTPGFSRREYRKSKTVATYVVMLNELEDAHYKLRTNGYISSYKTGWLLPGLHYGNFRGRYLISHDTIYISAPVHFGTYNARLRSRNTKDSFQKEVLIMQGHN